MIKFKQSIYFIALLTVLNLPLAALASESLIPDAVFSANLGQDSIDRGYTIDLMADNNFSLRVPAGSLLAPNQVIVKKIWAVDQSLPGGKEKLSDYWEVDLTDKNSYAGSKLVAQLKYQSSSNLKSVYYWDETAWQKVPASSINLDQGIISFIISSVPFRFVVLADSGKMAEGLASWYRYKGCNCAASPDYPKGTLLEVINPANNQSVVVKVNDYGPDRKIHPDRVIDLDLVAFKKIAPSWQGTVKVLVAPYQELK